MSVRSRQGPGPERHETGRSHFVRLAVTCGDPAGIGPEVALKALAQVPGIDPVLVGPRCVWREAEELLGFRCGWQILTVGSEPKKDWSWGRPTRTSGCVAARAVETAAAMALRRELDGLVTAPLTKEGLRAAGWAFPGHTELLEHLCGGAARATMLLAGARLRVLLVTTHLPLAEVPRAISRERVLETLTAGERGLREDLGIPQPRLAVLALNPHAGEGGILGREEETTIRPAVEEARARGVDAVGPLPADSAFHRAVSGEFDAVVAMFHDQGLGPLKLLHFHDGVNVTLGLPLVRTSPDHGTAFDLAGRGEARPDSFAEALRLAAVIVKRRVQGVTGGPRPEG